MAEGSQRKSAKTALDDETQKKRDRLMLWIFLIGGILIVTGMFFLAEFLSGG